MPYQIVVATPLADEGLNILKQAEDCQLTVIPPDATALQPYLPTLDALIIGDQFRVDAALLEAAPQLQIIGRAGAALDLINVQAATRRGVIVMNTPGVDAVTVAEYTFALLLGLVRHTVVAHQTFGQNLENPLVGVQLKGKILGIMGYGRVGQEVANRAIAFGLEVLVSDPYIPESQVVGQRLKLVGSDELLARADFVTLHMTPVPEIHQYINTTRLAKMKRGAYLINVKHHSLIQPDDVLAALENGQLAGIALDDFGGDLKHPLLEHPNVLHTHNMRFQTVEARQELSQLLAVQLLDALRKQNYRNAVNLPFMPGREYDVIQTQMRLAEKIGMLEHYLSPPTAIDRVELSIQGDEMEGLLKPMTVGILKGLLTPMLGNVVNYINAPILAHERGITVTQSGRLGLDSYPNLLICRVARADGFELIIAGAIFNETEPRIVQVDQYRTDFSPEGTLLIIGSYDVPGVIGRVGTFMANHGINIAGWRTSRVTKGGNTLSIIGIDEPLSEDLMNALREHEFIRHATQIVFS